MTDLALFDLAALAAADEPDAIAPERFTLAWHHPDGFDAVHAAAEQRQRRDYDDDLATRLSGMWRRDAMPCLRHLQDETIGTHRLWLGVAVIARRQVGGWYDDDGMPHRRYEHGPEARLVRGLCHGCGCLMAIAGLGVSILSPQPAQASDDAGVDVVAAPLAAMEGGIVTNPVPGRPDITMTSWPDQGLAWVASEPMQADAAGSVTVAAAQWYCEIRVPLMELVNGGLQWGGESTCDGDHTPSYIRADLQDTCAEGICIIWETKRGPFQSPSSQDYSRVSSLSYVTPCNTSEERKLRVRVFLSIDGVEVSSEFHPDAVRACHIQL